MYNCYPQSEWKILIEKYAEFQPLSFYESLNQIKTKVEPSSQIQEINII